MAERWVINASPLIVLARIGYEHLLLDIPDEICVPQAVVAEIEGGPQDDPARRVLSQDQFARVVVPPPSSEILGWDLGRGETEVLTFALANPGWVAILDDAAARRCARSFAISTKGTLAVVLLAKQRGLISSAASVLRQLREGGFRLDDTTIQRALAETVGEQWD